MKNQAFFASLCIILLMISFIPAMESTAGSPTAQTIVSLQGTVTHPPVGSYLVESDGHGGYQAINSTTGRISVSSMNVSQVINSIISNGITIAFGSGTFGFSSNLNLVGYSDFTLLGQSGTIFQRPANTNYTVYYNFYTFFPMVLVENCSNFQISGIVFDGNAGNNRIQDLNPNGDGGNINLMLMRCSGATITDVQSNDAWGCPITVTNSQFMTLTNINMTDNSWVPFQYCFAVGGSQYITVSNVWMNGYGKAIELFPPFTNIQSDDLYHNQYLTFTNFNYMQNWTASQQTYGDWENTNQSIFIWEANHCNFTDCNFLTAMSGVGNGILFYPWSIVRPLYFSSSYIIFQGCTIDAGSYSQGMALVNTTNIQLLDCTFLRGSYGVWLNGANNTQIIGCTFKGKLTPTGQQLYIGPNTSGQKCENTLVDGCTYENTNIYPGTAQLLVTTNGADNLNITSTNIFLGNPAVLIGSGNTGVNYGEH